MPKLTPSGTQFNANVMLPLNEHNGLFFFFFFYKNDPTSLYHTAENIAKFVEMCLSLCANNMPHFDNVEHHLHTLLHFQEKKKTSFFLSFSFFLLFVTLSILCCLQCVQNSSKMNWGIFFTRHLMQMF